MCACVALLQFVISAAPMGCSEWMAVLKVTREDIDPLRFCKKIFETGGRSPAKARVSPVDTSRIWEQYVARKSTPQQRTQGLGHVLGWIINYILYLCFVCSWGNVAVRVPRHDIKTSVDDK
ncbi:hypothetical protein BCR43DRAFT_493426 [Syncephalastrum racemosum]|uniref:Uncharacterized protein n=1 Tax=Syncephalastrum racemosum TaxID=13706 RepID=A0A1X2HAI7_SYNRA|nr:hypothetical protein BCR43DRAFT_493426 [Syncephalastrum racemosum]